MLYPLLSRYVLNSKMSLHAVRGHLAATGAASPYKLLVPRAAICGRATRRGSGSPDSEHGIFVFVAVKSVQISSRLSKLPEHQSAFQMPILRLLPLSDASL